VNKLVQGLKWQYQIESQHISHDSMTPNHHIIML